MVDKPNTTPIGQDRETLTFKALLYLNAAAHVQVCILFCMVYIPLLSLVQLGFPAIQQYSIYTRTGALNRMGALTSTGALINKTHLKGCLLEGGH